MHKSHGDMIVVGRVCDEAHRLCVCSYILWKTVAKHLPTPEQRTAFCSGMGEQLLQQMMPDVQQRLRAAAQKGMPLDVHGLRLTHCRADLFDTSVLQHPSYVSVYAPTC